MTTEEQEKLETSPDYVITRRYGNSLRALRIRYPEKCPDHIIAQVLGTTEQAIEERFNALVKQLKNDMGIVV